jgi:diacylglycerol kinase (ATP)
MRDSPRRLGGTQLMLTGIRDTVIIHNPTAGGGRGGHLAHLEDARRILSAAGITAELQPTSGPKAATELARAAVAANRQLVIACGGDGTVNEVVNGLAGSQVPLAVLPAGTANVLAKELNIPWDIPRAAELIPRANLRRIALGLARPLAHSEGERFFLCVAGAGPDGMMIHRVGGALKKRGGQVAYWLEGFKQVVLYKFPKFRISSPQEQIEGTLVVVGRTKNYGGPFRITTRADLFANQFELAVVCTRSAMRYLSYLPKLWRNKLRSEKGVYFWMTDQLRCEPIDGKTVYAQIDGEPFGELPMEFRIMPDALTLAVPETPGPRAAST